MRSYDHGVPEEGLYFPLYFSSFCRTAPCPLEVTIESQFALVLG